MPDTPLNASLMSDWSNLKWITILHPGERLNMHPQCRQDGHLMSVTISLLASSLTKKSSLMGDHKPIPICVSLSFFDWRVPWNLLHSWSSKLFDHELNSSKLMSIFFGLKTSVREHTKMSLFRTALQFTSIVLFVFVLDLCLESRFVKLLLFGWESLGGLFVIVDLVNLVNLVELVLVCFVWFVCSDFLDVFHCCVYFDGTDGYDNGTEPAAALVSEKTKPTITQQDKSHDKNDKIS